MTEIALTLESMAHGGDAIGYHEEKAIFVPFGISGETVRVEITESHASYARARLIEVLEPSPARRTPPCPHFGTCGGCQWQHISYEAQLKAKREIVRYQLRRIGKQEHPNVLETIGMTDPWRYRNHVQAQTDKDGHLAFREHGSHKNVPIETCPILHPLIAELWDEVEIDVPSIESVSLRAGTRTGERLILFHGTEETPPSLTIDEKVSCVYQHGDDDPLLMAGEDHYHEVLCERRFRVSSLSFFQCNTEQAERLIQVVDGYLALDESDVLLDLYCGVGTFMLCLAPQVEFAIGIEESESAVADARANNNYENTEILQGKVADVLSEYRVLCSAAVLDPPRAGCSEQALRGFLESSPERVAYVSCDPATLARDVARLTEGGYELVEVQPVDLFAQTYHIESVAFLRRGSD